MRSFVKSTIAVAVISAIANSVYYTATAEMNHLSFTRPMPLIGLMIANHVVYALLLSYLYPRFRRDGTLPEGARFGSLMGALMFLPMALVVRSAWYVPADWAFVSNTIFALTSSALMGLVIARIHRSPGIILRSIVTAA